MTDRYYVAVDLGGTNLRGALVDHFGKIVRDSFVATPKNRNQIGIVNAIVNLINNLSDGYNVLSAGLGIPGIVDYRKQTVLKSPHFPEWDNFEITKVLSEQLGKKVTIDNDANMHLVGEYVYGVAKSFSSVVLLTLGTGIGGAMIIDGQLWHGERGFAGEVGHIVIDPNGPACGCGGRGCLEKFASASGFSNLAAKLTVLERLEISALAGCDIANLKSKDVYNLALAKAPSAMKLYQIFGDYLGAGIASLINVLGVTKFVIGGGLSNAYELFIDATHESIFNHTYSAHKSTLQIVRSELLDSAGILGSAYCARMM